VYTGHGFDVEEGAKHTLYQHPKYPRLVTTVGRSDPVLRAYIAQAIALIDELARLEERP